MRVRNALLFLHRETGFLCLGLTVVYAVSGVAVNHRHHWDYNQTREVVHHRVGTPAQLLGDQANAYGPEVLAAPELLAKRGQKALIESLLSALKRTDRPQRVFWRGPDRLTLVFEPRSNDLLDYLPSTGMVEETRVRERFLLRSLNFLHLNEARHIWTYIADAYAVVLLFLAISGALIVRGRRGLWGRGGVLVVLGILVPLLAVLVLR